MNWTLQREMSKIKRVATAEAHGVVTKQGTLVWHQIGRDLAGTVWLDKLGANCVQEELESMVVVEQLGMAGSQEDIRLLGMGKLPAQSTLTVADLIKTTQRASKLSTVTMNTLSTIFPMYPVPVVTVQHLNKYYV